MNMFDVLGQTYYYTVLEDGSLEILDQNGNKVHDNKVYDLIAEENDSIEYMEFLMDLNNEIY